MIELLKNIIYSTAVFFAKVYWCIVKPKTSGARVMLVCNDKFFLVRPRTLRYWNLPGGGINKNERTDDAAIRELYEETNIRIDDVDYMLGIYNSKGEGKRDTVYVYVKHLTHETSCKLSIEISEAKWFSYDQLPETIAPFTKKRINEYRKGIREIEGLWSQEQ